MKQITGPSIAKLDGRYVLVDDRWLDPPVEDWYDPAGGLPADPAVGDRYIAETTANGWTQDYIYEWDGDEWIESVPEEGWMVWMLLELLFYVFFSGGWMLVGETSFLRLDASNDPVTGAIQFQNDTDSTTAFQILDADGGVPVFNVDTTNERVGIGTATPLTVFEVNAGASQIYLHNSAAGVATFFVSNASTGPVVYASGSGYNYFQGNVGVGIAGGTAKLQVNGGADIVQTLIKAHSTQTNATAQHQTSNADVHNEFFVAHASNLYTTVFNKQSSPLLDFKVLSDTKDAIHVDASEDLLKIAVNTKIGDGGTTNYTEVEADGTIAFKGAATVFKDINMGAAVLTRPAASQPTEVNFVDEAGADTGIASLGFAVGEKVSGNFELQHDYKEGTDLAFHVHWQGPAAPTGTDKVKWQLTYTVAQSETTLNATTTIVIETDFDTQYEFKRSDFAAITGTNFNIEDQFLFTLERIAASAVEYGGDAIVATVGIHYEVDTIGSRQVGSK